MPTLLPLLSVLLTGVIAGAYLSVVIHDFRVEALSGPAFVAMHQMRDRTYRLAMPILGFGALTCLIGAAAASRGGVPAALFIASAALCAADIAIAIGHQVPLNRLMQSWDPAAPPAGWSSVRDRWERCHRLRALIGGCFFVLALAALAREGAAASAARPDAIGLPYAFRSVSDGSDGPRRWRVRWVVCGIWNLRPCLSRSRPLIDPLNLQLGR